MAIGLGFFSLFVLVLELYLGVAILGWVGDKMIVEREKSPGPYWFAIALHSIIGIGLPTLFMFVE